MVEISKCNWKDWPEIWLKKNKRLKNKRLKSVENAMQAIKNNDIGLVSRLIVRVKDTNKPAINIAPPKGAAGISQDKDTNVAIVVNSSMAKVLS